ncbi:MAG: zf-TFIIB domain-containing protein [Leptospirales bacterium]|nr:zf-TFIIB domain-containing protein [Leptospirales bacterium]
MSKLRVASGVEIDCCDDHGVWLDVGELDQIANHFEKNSQGAVSGIGKTILDSAARGAGFGAGASLARSLAQRLFG